MDKSQVELLNKEDAAEIEELFKMVWPHAEEYPEDWRRKRCLSRAAIVAEMTGGVRYFGVKVDGKIAGLYKAVMTESGLLGEHQTVHPEYRGMGLAYAMYDQFIDFAKSVGMKKILVNIIPTQIASKKCVERYGFVRDGPAWEQARGMWVQTYECDVDNR